MTPFDETRLRSVMEQYPLLTHFGFGEYGQPFIATKQGRNDLLKATDEINRARAWLKTQQQRVSINPKHSSYGLKHVAERAAGGYISNGSLIAAALMEGWKVQRIDLDNPNARLNISERHLKRSCNDRP